MGRSSLLKAKYDPGRSISIQWPEIGCCKRFFSPEYCIDRPFGFLLGVDELQVNVILDFLNKLLTGFLAFVYDNYSFDR